ncbi:hypothetical protein NOR53_2721 [gamma proteobacterium NOR5-3]|nr:hypothetical protein NOR53_2721 [gamma proteobacterium NOR5-3]
MFRHIKGGERKQPQFIGEARRQLSDTYFLLREVFPSDMPPAVLREQLLTLVDEVCVTAEADFDLVTNVWASSSESVDDAPRRYRR